MNKLSAAKSHLNYRAYSWVSALCANEDFIFRVSKKRNTKLGDFRVDLKSKKASISVNQDLHEHQFLFTFLHEYAHYEVWKYGSKRAKPHGKEWKIAFSQLLQQALEHECFPTELQAPIARFALQPKASTFADISLMQSFRKFEPYSEQIHLQDLQENDVFRMQSGKMYVKGKTRRTRVLCKELNSRRQYLIHKMAEVDVVESAAESLS